MIRASPHNDHFIDLVKDIINAITKKPCPIIKTVVGKYASTSVLATMRCVFGSWDIFENR